MGETDTEQHTNCEPATENEPSRGTEDDALDEEHNVVDATTPLLSGQEDEEVEEHAAEEETTDDDREETQDSELEEESNNDLPPWRRTRFQRAAITILLSVTWASGILFGLYMIGHYLVFGFIMSWFEDDAMQRWNMVLPSLYTAERPFANAGMGLHLLGGSITIILGAIQLLAPIRRKYPRFHRWTGRVYLASSALTATGGLVYIWTGRGCIGGWVMDIAFSLCGVLTLVASAQTYRHAALTKQYKEHELWATRLYALMIGSWLYRMEYTLFIVMGIPHDRIHYIYGLDYVMDFFFFLPNLLVVEFLWRNKIRSKWFWNCVAILILVVSLILMFTTFLMSAEIWIPGMVGKLGEISHHHDYDDDVYEYAFDL